MYLLKLLIKVGKDAQIPGISPLPQPPGTIFPSPFPRQKGKMGRGLPYAENWKGCP